MSRPELILSASALRENWRIIREKADGAAVWCVLKGSAYGMGLVGAAEILASTGADRFAVTEPQEAAELRAAGIAGRILLLRPTELCEDMLEGLAAGAELTVGSRAAAELLEGICAERELRAEIHIELDAGMGRGGFRFAEAGELPQLLAVCPHLVLRGIYAHGNRAFDKKKYTRRAVDRLSAAAETLRAAGVDPGEVHLADSVALFRFPFARLDAVRVGSALAGGLLAGRRDGLVRVARAECPIMAIRNLRAGESVGYGDSFRAKRDMTVAVLPMGYADGALVTRAKDLRRPKDALHGMLSILRDRLRRRDAYVTLNGKPCRVLGYVGMKHLVCDVTGQACAPGDRVVVPVDLLLAGRLLPTRWEDDRAEHRRIENT